MRPSKEETLHYLGWRGQPLDARTEQLVEESIRQCAAAARPRHVAGHFALEYNKDSIHVVGTALSLTGCSIRDYLAGAQRVCLFAATLGQEIDHLIRRCSYTDMTRAAILDAAATALIEAYCDEASADLCQLAGHPGERFSPGYGDLPIALQPAFLEALNAPKAIGLTCNQAFMLNPGKSVTAVIGFFSDPVNQTEKCSRCLKRDSCPYNTGKDDSNGKGCHSL